MRLAERGRGVGPVEIIVRRRCRHGEALPHHYHLFSADGSDEWEYCVDGDRRSFQTKELRERVLAVLQDSDPRLPFVEAATKADQIVGMLVDSLRVVES